LRTGESGASEQGLDRGSLRPHLRQMVKYTIDCRSCGWSADSWFRSSADYDRLASSGLVSCAHCGSADTGKGLMAPAVKSSSTSPQPHDGDFREALREFRRKVEATGEDVGTRFADEARRIAAGDAPERVIYGESTPEERRCLAEEGIAVSTIPWVPLHDA
jgi:hypothetical protein